VARIGEGWCFFTNGVSYIAVIIGLLMMKVHCVHEVVSFAVGIVTRGFQFVNRTGPSGRCCSC